MNRSVQSHARAGELIRSDPEILGGTPVFTGTRVPVKTLFDYLVGGHSIPEFLDDFPSVDQQQAVGVLQLGADLLVEGVRERTQARPYTKSA